MRTIKFSFSTDKVGSKQEETFEVDDETTDEELDDMLNDWVAERCNAIWQEE